MKNDCVHFLHWALPQLNLRWPGFRKVRGQVCKRIKRRMLELELERFEEYRHWLTSHPGEWVELDGLCRITISRFYRDWAVFDHLKEEILPKLAEEAVAAERPLRIWSAGCASGEEPYTLSLIVHFVLQPEFPSLKLQITATDIDPHMLERAKKGCYPPGSLKGLPEDWLEGAFSKDGEEFCIYARFGEYIDWEQQDIRTTQPEGPFDLLLCRNLVATYFDAALQSDVFNRIINTLRARGVVVLGNREKLPAEIESVQLLEAKWNLYEKVNIP